MCVCVCVCVCMCVWGEGGSGGLQNSSEEWLLKSFLRFWPLVAFRIQRVSHAELANYLWRNLNMYGNRENKIVFAYLLFYFINELFSYN